MKFLKIVMTLVLSTSVVLLVSAPQVPKAKEVETELITISSPMVISVKR